MVVTLALCGLLFTALCVNVVVSAAAVEMQEEEVKIPTEKEVKKMKIREIKTFLEDRGKVCPECQEKADFVRVALENREAPVLPHKRKVSPKGDFWEVWSNIAKEQCEVVGAKQANKAEVCEAIASAVDSVFMQHGKRTAAKLKKKPVNLLKTSVGEPYIGAGRRVFSKVANWCFKNAGKCTTSSKVQPLLETDDKIKAVKLIEWITNVGIENTNPMYEMLKDKKLAHDEL